MKHQVIHSPVAVGAVFPIGPVRNRLCEMGEARLRHRACYGFVACSPAGDQLFAIAQPYISHDDIGKLTPREREVARKVGEGLVNKDIARQLSISLSTVNVHLQAIRRKLGLKNRTAAALALSQSNFAVERKQTTALPPTKDLYRSKSQDERGSTSMRPIIQ